MSDYLYVMLLIAVVAFVQERRFSKIQGDLTRIRETTNKVYWMVFRQEGE